MFKTGERVRARASDADRGHEWQIEHEALRGDFYHGDFMGQRIIDPGTEPGFIIRNMRTGERAWVLGFELERV